MSEVYAKEQRNCQNAKVVEFSSVLKLAFFSLGLLKHTESGSNSPEIDSVTLTNNEPVLPVCFGVSFLPVQVKFQCFRASFFS